MFSENLKHHNPVDCKKFPDIRFNFSENDSLFDEDPMISTLFFFFTEWSRFLDALVIPNSDKVWSDIIFSEGGNHDSVVS